LAFFLDWPRLDLAAKLVVNRRAEWEGRHYEALLAAAETLEPDHPVAATIGRGAGNAAKPTAWLTSQSRA
jgi:hypothetical protein